MPHYDDRDGGTRLYVGRLASRARSRDLEDIFGRYGRRNMWMQLRLNVGDSSTVHSINVLGGGDEDETEFEQYKRDCEEAIVLNKSELEKYLDEKVEDNSSDFDILAWWKGNKGKYPIMARIAKDIIAISISTVASESAFSTGGRFLSPHRRRLHPDILEALMCAQNWLWAPLRGGVPEEEIYYKQDEKKPTTS